MIPLKFAICFLFVAGLASLMSCQASITQEDWAVVIERLEETEHDKEEDYLFTAKNWLEESRNSETKPSEGVIEALESLERFRVIVHDAHCDKESKEFKKWLQSELNGKAGPLALIIHYLSWVDSTDCLKVYHKSYMSQLEHYPDKQGLKRMEIFFFELFCSTVMEGSSDRRKYAPLLSEYVGTSWIHIETNAYNVRKLFISESGEWPARAWEQIGDIGYDTVDILASRQRNTELVKSNTRTLKNGGIVIGANGARELFSRLILDSCETFIQFFGPTVFELAQGDIEYFEIWFPSLPAGSPLWEFLLYWAQYKSCLRLTGNQQERSRLLDLIGQVAARRQGE